MLCTYLAIQAAIIFAATDMAPVTDAQIVGIWEPRCEGCFDVHGTPRIMFFADHTCIHKGFTNEGPEVTRATWRIRDRELITRFAEGAVMHELVLSVTADEFKTRSGEQIYTYTRVKPERTPASNQTMERTAGSYMKIMKEELRLKKPAARHPASRRSSCSR